MAMAVLAGAAGSGCREESADRRQPSTRSAAAAEPVIRAPKLPAAQRLREARRVQRLIADFATGSTANDPSICDRLFTLRYLKATTRRSAAGALAACRRQVVGEGGHMTHTRIERIDLGRTSRGAITGRVQYLANVDGTHARAIVLVRRQGDGYRLDGAVPARQPNASP